MAPRAERCPKAPTTAITASSSTKARSADPMNANTCDSQRGHYPRHLSPARILRAVGLAVVLSGGLGGCFDTTHIADYEPEAHTERFPIKVTRSMARLDLDVDGNARLGPDDRARVAQFARDYHARSGGPLI